MFFRLYKNFCNLSFSAPVALALCDGKVSIVSADAFGHRELFIYCLINTAYILFYILIRKYTYY